MTSLSLDKAKESLGSFAISNQKNGAWVYLKIQPNNATYYEINDIKLLKQGDMKVQDGAEGYTRM